MNNIIRDNTVRGLTIQRNVFITLIMFLLVVNLLFGIVFFRKSERIVVIPAVLEKEFWIDGGKVSASYLEQMGSFVGDLLLTRSPASSDMQLGILLRQTAPEFALILSNRLESELTKLKKDNASYVFFKTKVIVDPQKLSVLLEGDRILFLKEQVLSTVHERYLLTFINFGGRLLLSSIERVGQSD
jgi:conjugal transfer pilus assembly protein TraE